MTARPNLPVLGAALTLDMVEHYRPWLLGQQRDLELQAFWQPEVLDGDWRAVVARARHLLDGHTGRLGLHGPFWGFKLDSHDPEIRRVVQRRLLQALEAAEAVGASQCVLHSPVSTWDHNNHAVWPLEATAQQERVAATLRPVIARAEAIGCTLVIENIEDKDPLARVRLAAAMASPRVRVSLDTYVTAAGDALEHVHLQDSDGFADRHWQPGDGSVNWPAIFAALAGLRSTPRLLLELRDQSRLMQGAARLVELGLAA
jgi:sugar phosphate isomerase/epimerase